MCPSLLRLLVLLVAFGLVFGCAAKKDDEPSGDGGGDGGPTASGDSDIPAPPRSGRPLTDNWDLGEISRAKRETSNNLRQIGLALHAYHDAHNALPAGIFDRSGKKLGLSWRVAILPQIEQAALYEQFKLAEPWDSPANKKLIKKMPRIFAITNTAAPNGYTYYRGFAGAGMLAQLQPQGQSGQPSLGVKIPTVQDGLSNTIMVAEVDDPVIWTKPEEPVVDAKSPLPKLGGVFKDGFHGVMGDGVMRWVKMPIANDSLRHFIMRNDGNIVNIP